MPLTLSVNEAGLPVVLISGASGEHQYVVEQLATTDGVRRWRVFRTEPDPRGLDHTWVVWHDGHEWGCGCPARKYAPGKECKHMLKTREYVALLAALTAGGTP